ARNWGRITASVRSIPEVHIGIGTGEINLFRRQGQGRRKIETKCLRGNHVLRHFLATVRQNRERSNFQGLASGRWRSKGIKRHNEEIGRASWREREKMVE